MATAYGECASELAEEGFPRDGEGSLLGRDGSVRATSREGAILVLLTPERLEELVTAGVARRHGPGEAWCLLDPELEPATARGLLESALT